MPRPKSCDQTRLTAARAKYRLAGDVIHSAKSIRRVRPLLSPATLPQQIPGGDDFAAVGQHHLARFAVADDGRRDIARPPSCETRAKKAAYPQKSRFVHLSKG